MRSREVIAVSALLILIVLLFRIAPGIAAEKTGGGATFFYHDLDFGSEAEFNPLSSFVNYSLDTLQLSDNFDFHDLEHRFRLVMKHLGDPQSAIDESGGFNEFVNRQILPIDFDNLRDSKEMIPNYALHLLGGGLVFRKNAEWLRAHDYPHPWLSAAVLSMGAEVLQEVIEKKSTTADDEVADVMIFRPVGMILFGNESIARFFAEDLGMLEWANQPMYRVHGGYLSNLGENYVVRPSCFAYRQHRPFVYFGMTTLVGTSYRIDATDSVSWGAGGAMVDAARNHIRIRSSFGLFYDRNDSLLASATVNSTEHLVLRVNVYPGMIGRGLRSPGIFVGLGDEGDFMAGLTMSLLPAGLAAN